MHTVEEIIREYKKLDQIVGVDTSELEIAFSSRAVYQYGCCKYQQKKRKVVPYKILIASFLREEEEAFWNTVRHEYAHAAAALLTGKNQGHNSVWKAVCQKIGADPARLAEACSAQKEKSKGQVWYEIICQACGTRYKRIRRSRFVVEVLENPDQPTSYRCHCGCRFFQCLQCNVPQKTRGENE